MELSVPVLGRVVPEFVGLNIEGGYSAMMAGEKQGWKRQVLIRYTFSPLVVVFIHFAYRSFRQPPIHLAG
jgi:hypothetical protein